MSELTRKEKIAAFKNGNIDVPVRYGLDAVLYAIRSLITSTDGSEIFYGNLASRLKKIVIDENYKGRYAGVKTAAVAIEKSDVVLIVYSPFFDALPLAERVEVIKHELQHIAHRHLFRGTVEKGYHPRIANIAMDAVINQHNLLNELRPDTYIDYAKIPGAVEHRSFEEYYDLLVENGEKDGDEGDNSCPDCGGSGEKNSAGSPDSGDSDGDESDSGSGESEETESGSENGSGEGSGEGSDEESGEGSGSGSEAGDESGEHSCGSGSGSGEGSGESCPSCNGSGKSGGSGGEDTDYGKLSGSHEFFGEVDDESNSELAEEKLKGYIRKSAEATKKSCGNVSAEVAGILAEINEPYKVNWKKALKNWATEAYNREKYYSPFREHKVFKDCYPAIGFKKLPEFAVYIDVSGSVSQEDFNKFMAEIVGINKALKAQLSVSQFDTRVHKTDTVRTAADVPKLTREYAGGTRFDDILRHAKENKVSNLIIMTDGFAPEINTKGFNVLWAYTPYHKKHPGRGVVIED